MKKTIGVAILLLILLMPLFFDENTVIAFRSRLLFPIGESGSPQVIVGKDDFLFFAESVNGLISPPSDRQLEEMTDAVLSLSQALEDDHRTLTVLIAPDKRSVYSEKLPTRLDPRADTWTPLHEALLNAGIRSLNVLPILISEKETGCVYFAGDTHWNARGALAVYRFLADELPIPNADSYPDMDFAPGAAGDMIRLCRPGGSVTEPDALPALERSYRSVRPFSSLDTMKIETLCDRSDFTLLVIRDSFGKGLFPYLAENVGKLIYSRSYQDIPGQAAAAGADAVLLEIAERDAVSLPEKLRNAKEN